MISTHNTITPFPVDGPGVLPHIQPFGRTPYADLEYE